jgi:phenylacetate-CoA ligase
MDPAVSSLSIASQWSLDRRALKSIQLQRLNALLRVARQQPFYRERLVEVALPLESLEQLRQLPLISKSDLVASSPGEPGRIFGLPRPRYCRFHQTSGTSGHPMPVLDTAEDWRWWLACWQHVLHAADVTDRDVAMMAFSFGPFIGFWTASDALVQTGALVLPGGGMPSETRLRMILDHRCTVVCCTPTYALHLLRVAQEHGIDLRASAVTRLIVAGEPGGSLPEVRCRIQSGWNAKVIDHAGASEIGAWGFGSPDGSGLHVIETEFIAERLCFDEQHRRGRPAGEGEPGELVLTGLGRHGGPAIRYRTGDIVRGFEHHDQPCRFLFLSGGVLGRNDDMMVIRGVNVFPSSIESIVRTVHPTVEFRMIASKHGEMDALAVETELEEADCARLRELFQQRLAMRVEVRAVPPGSLPRFEAKAKRFVDQRG